MYSGMPLSTTSEESPSESKNLYPPGKFSLSSVHLHVENRGNCPTVSRVTYDQVPAVETKQGTEYGKTSQKKTPRIIRNPVLLKRNEDTAQELPARCRRKMFRFSVNGTQDGVMGCQAPHPSPLHLQVHGLQKTSTYRERHVVTHVEGLEVRRREGEVTFQCNRSFGFI